MPCRLPAPSLNRCYRWLGPLRQDLGLIKHSLSLSNLPWSAFPIWRHILYGVSCCPALALPQSAIASHFVNIMILPSAWQAGMYIFSPKCWLISGWCTHTTPSSLAFLSSFRLRLKKACRRLRHSSSITPLRTYNHYSPNHEPSLKGLLGPYTQNGAWTQCILMQHETQRCSDVVGHEGVLLGLASVPHPLPPS